MKFKYLVILLIITVSSACSQSRTKSLLIPVQENDFKLVYKPKGDVFFGPDTATLKEGEWYEDWVPNDHGFIKADDGKWHLFGITHPYIDPKDGGIHKGENASFHAVSTVNTFKEAFVEDHFEDKPKVLPPQERPGEGIANHAPYVIKKDDLYYMVYGPSPIRLAVSKDLYKWEVKAQLFAQEGGSRDPSLLVHNGKYYMVYCSKNSVLLRESDDMLTWSEPKIIFTSVIYEPESPSLIFHNGTYYLVVCSWDGIWDKKELVGAYQEQSYVLQSDDMFNFGENADKQVATLLGHAPEIFQAEDGQWYISSAEWPNRGVSVDKLNWVEK